MTSTVTVTASETSEAAPSTSSERAPEPTEAAPQEQVIGYTGAPGQDKPHVLDKTIDHCAAPGAQQTGMTYFTDGTTGWTEKCAAEMGG